MNIVIHKFNFPIYGLLIILSIISGIIFIYLNLRNKKIESEKIILSFTLMIVLVILGGKIYTKLIGEGKSLLTAGLSSYGGAIGLILSVLIYIKIYPDHKKAFIESYILSLPLIYSISKLGCFLVGCCHGIKYKGIFNVTYIDISKISYFPIQLLETIIFMIIFITCIYIYKKRNKYIVEIVFILCGVSKFILDYLRYSHINQPISINQIFSIIFIIIGISLLILKKRKKHILN